MVAVIVVTYNGMPYLEKCLSSISCSEIVVIDNNSADGTAKKIRENYPEVDLIELNENIGFGGANNIGISWALKKGAKHFLLLNQDAYILDDALIALTEFQTKNPEFGILSPMHFKSDRIELDERFENYMRLRSDGDFDKGRLLEQDLKDLYEMEFVNAAAWLVSRECIEKVGGFDPLFFHYGEDDNYCQRVLYHGFKIGVYTRAGIIHDRIFNSAKISKYSKKYFQEQVRKYKVKYSNINNPNALNEMNVRIIEISRGVLSNLYRLKLKELGYALKELFLLKKIKGPITRSYNKNRRIGMHYIQ